VAATETSASDKRLHLEEIRDEDLEPYLTLRYIARLFKIFAILLVVLMIGEVVTGLVGFGTGAILNLIGEATKLLVIAGLMWAGGDITMLIIDAGHDLRVARILLGRINSALHGDSEKTVAARPTTATTQQSRA
jgi:hypothetical protein